MNIIDLEQDTINLNTKYYMNKNKNAEKSNQIEILNKNNSFFNKNFNNITRINIDSRYRNIESKNIISNNITYLTTNPLYFTNNTNIIKIYHSNHGFQKEDKIILQGVQPNIISIINGLTFTKDNEYIRINHKDHNLNNNLNNSTSIIIKLSNIIGNLNNKRTLLNIPINELNNNHNIYFIRNKTENPSNDFYYIKISTKVSQDYEYSLSSIYINFIQLAGVSINQINANYPRTALQINGYHIIYNIIDSNYYEIQVTDNAITTIALGGNNIWISQVLDFIEGYPINNYYKINLKKTFYNVNRIKLISTEFPNTERVIKNYPLSKKNNMLFWQILEDGDDIYSIEITPGNYTLNTLSTELKKQIGNIIRPITNIYNINIDNTKMLYYTYNLPLIDINSQNDLFTIKLLQRLTISKPLSLSNYAFEDGFNRLRIYHPNHNLNIGDEITISNAVSTNNIPDLVINSSFNIERILDRNTYEVKLPRYTASTVQNDITNGGSVVLITYPLKFRLLFDRPYTLGNILGFKDVGKPTSVTSYNTIITNNTFYENDILDRNITNTINLSGDNYILMCSPLFKESSFTTGNIDGVFAKLLLAGDPGTIMFNQFIQLGEYFKEPINTLSDFEVTFYDPTGELFNFGSMEHSYTLEIYEDHNFSNNNNNISNS
jgi:hypothetical protein